ASTTVVPEPTNGSKMTLPRTKWRFRNTSTSCGMNFPRYGWRLWTCLVRSTCGSSSSDHESSRSSPEYNASCVRPAIGCGTLLSRSDGLVRVFLEAPESRTTTSLSQKGDPREAGATGFTVLPRRPAAAEHPVFHF